MLFPFCKTRDLRILALVFSGIIMMSGCDGGSQTTFATLTGSAGDGPVAHAKVDVFDALGRLHGSTITDALGAYSLEIPSDAPPPLRVVISANIDPSTGQRLDVDMVTGQPLDLPLEAMHAEALSSVTNNNVNINPLSTLVSATAKALAGLGKTPTTAQISMATSQVRNVLGFGLDPFIDPVKTAVDTSNVASIIKANEAAAEFLRRTKVSTGKSIEETIIALAEDLTDGALDGQVAAGVTATQADAQMAASANAEQAQVLLEVLSNQLHVNGVDVTSSMNQTIQTTQPEATDTVEAVAVSAAVKQQFRAASQAAASLDASANAGSNRSTYVAVQAFANALVVGAAPTPIGIANAPLLSALNTATLNTTSAVLDSANVGHVSAANRIVSNALKFHLATDTAQVTDYQGDGSKRPVRDVPTQNTLEGQKTINLGAFDSLNASQLAANTGGKTPTVSLSLDAQNLPVGFGSALVKITLLDNLSGGSTFFRDLNERQIALTFDVDWTSDGTRLLILPAAGEATANYFVGDSSALLETPLTNAEANVLSVNTLSTSLTLSIGKLFNINTVIGIALQDLAVVGGYAYTVSMTGFPLVNLDGSNMSGINGTLTVSDLSVVVP